ncbi:flavin monoamine oxidase family protein [Cupriavidus sp. BIC8F]|uniref:flavin monoamine oxidase family protein n=1 Tax=Cupriavidus sp. BIC8F TaxID=3079014 RepID=UPI002916DF66|nr:FAD-dependent oxidoreductase [Cupriavidus sp. BIC8F]
MRSVRCVIVGGGLSGLYAATLLKQHGVGDYLLIEERDRLGGRIHSVAASGRRQETPLATESNAIDRVDLGPTWFWPAYQHQFDKLIHALGVERFPQHDRGWMMAERTATGAPMRIHGFPNSPTAMRLMGGMGALIDALTRRVSRSRVLTGESVRHIRIAGHSIEVESHDASDRLTITQAAHLLLAVPPRLSSQSIEFSPALPPRLLQPWLDTPTWMAGHAKYAAVYETPFWRAEGLSGEARSAVGPLAEIHDATMPGGSAALFGFFGMPAHTRRGVPTDTLKTHCRAQLARLFGPKAAVPSHDFIKDWATDSLTSTPPDLELALSRHSIAPPATALTDPWKGRVIGIASEWSPNFPGYVAGAIDAATRGIESIFGKSPNTSCNDQ